MESAIKKTTIYSFVIIYNDSYWRFVLHWGFIETKTEEMKKKKNNRNNRRINTEEKYERNSDNVY